MARDRGDMMLKDGKFIREQPPVIGANFYKTESREYSEEELEWQETLLAAEEVQDQFDLAEIIIGVMLIIPAVLLVFLLIIGAFTDA
jgi:NADPH-dependent glutamate synthase beta subunit-like oxidoreductase